MGTEGRFIPLETERDLQALTAPRKDLDAPAKICGREYAFVDGLHFHCDLPEGHVGNCTTLPTLD